MRKPRLRRTLLLGLLLVLLIPLISQCRHRHPGALEPGDTRHELPAYSDEVLSPEQREVLETFAPVIRHGYDPAKPHLDTPTRMDFDGDWIGRNNEESIRATNAVPATVYYSLVESETHWFLTYFLFHPLDWEPWPNLLWLGRWHENDGESLQVVVRKSDRRPVVLATQAHLGTALCIDANAGLASGSWSADFEQLPLAASRPIVFVEKGGHGIHPWTAERDGPSLMQWDAKGAFAYELLPLHDHIWKWYRTQRELGPGKMMDGAFDYESDAVSYQNLPRHFDSDRLSVALLWKFDAGISPFAFSHSLSAKDLGVLFFDPAKKYSESLGGEETWSRRYLYNPYLP